MNSASRKPLKVGDWVRVAQVPPGLTDPLGLETKTVFERALGKVFRIQAFGDHGHIELVVSRRRSPTGAWDLDTIWIEPEFVVRSRKPRRKK